MLAQRPEPERRRAGEDRRPPRERAPPTAGAAARRRRRSALAPDARAREVAPDDPEVQRQVERDQRQRPVAEQIVPVEHRQLLIGDPENAERCRGQDIAEQKDARPHVEGVARRRSAAQRLDRPRGESNQERRGDPQELGVRSLACRSRQAATALGQARRPIRVPSVLPSLLDRRLRTTSDRALLGDLHSRSVQSICDKVVSPSHERLDRQGASSFPQRRSDLRPLCGVRSAAGDQARAVRRVRSFAFSAGASARRLRRLADPRPTLTVSGSAKSGGGTRRREGKERDFGCRRSSVCCRGSGQRCQSEERAPLPAAAREGRSPENEARPQATRAQTLTHRSC